MNLLRKTCIMNCQTCMRIISSSTYWGSAGNARWVERNCWKLAKLRQETPVLLNIALNYGAEVIVGQFKAIASR